jgi:hypothetical protein
MLNPGSVSPEAFGAGLARGFQGLSGLAQQIYQEEQKKSDDIALTDAITGAYKADTRHRYSTGDDGSLPGFAVMEGDQLFSNAAKVSQSFHKDLAGIAEKLTPSQRTRFVQSTQGLMHGFESSMTVRIAQERHRRNAEVTNNAVEYINDSVTQNAARYPDTVDPVAIREAVLITASTIRDGATRDPSRPPVDVVDAKVRDAQYKTTDKVFRSLLTQERMGIAQSLLDDEALTSAISPETRSHAVKIIREHKETSGVFGEAEAAYMKAKEAMLANPEDRAKTPQLRNETMRARAKALIGVSYAQNSEGRGKALAVVEQLIAQDYRSVMASNEGYTELFAKQLINGDITLAQVQRTREYADLAPNQMGTLGEISALRTKNPDEVARRHAFVESNWTEMLSAPSDIKGSFAQISNLQFTAVPDLKHLSGMPLGEREKDPLWPIIRKFAPEMNADFPSAAEVSSSQSKLRNIWPMSVKDQELITKLQNSIRSDIRKEGDNWDNQYAKLAREVTEEQMALVVSGNGAGARAARAQRIAEHYDLLNRAKAQMPSYEKRDTPPTREQIEALSSQLIVTKATRPGFFGGTSFTIEQLQKAKPETQKEWSDQGRIPIDQIAPSWRADIEKSFGVQKFNDALIERAAFRQWEITQKSLRPSSIIRP